MLNYLQRMWMGLEKRWHARRGGKGGPPAIYAVPKDVV
jgi:hypothetical protein